MKIAVYANRAHKHHLEFCGAFYEGLRRHGLDASFHEFDTIFRREKDADLHVFWSMNPAKNEYIKNSNFICLERGYIDRMNYASISFKGLHGQSLLDFTNQGNERVWRKGWAMKPEYKHGDKIIIMGQVPGDSALEGCDIYEWARRKADNLSFTGAPAFFRPHPLHKVLLDDVPALEGDLDDVLRQANHVFTYNSNAGVDCWLAGVRCYADHPGSMLYAYQDELGRCKRPYNWLNDISYKQYNVQEMESGEAWANVAPQILQFCSVKADS